MKLGVNFPDNWKEKSVKEQILLSDLLYGFAIEDIMKRTTESGFREYLWLANEKAIGIESYKKKTKEGLEFLYVESGKRSFQEGPVPGQVFNESLMKLFAEELFADKENGKIRWLYNMKESDHGVLFLATGSYMDMKVPVNIGISVIPMGAKRPKKREFAFLFDDKKICEYLSYSKESVLSESIFEIMRKLELISNMEAYDAVNDIIKNQSISGRHIIEDLKVMGEKEPKVVTMKRLEQVASYKNYGYMKKKWQQYAKKHKNEVEDWEEVMERMENFLRPLWTALCKDEIFFDDWMPELGRFLG